LELQPNIPRALPKSKMRIGVALTLIGRLSIETEGDRRVQKNLDFASV
jgi:hypothetical protein